MVEILRESTNMSWSLKVTLIFLFSFPELDFAPQAMPKNKMLRTINTTAFMGEEDNKLQKSKIKSVGPSTGPAHTQHTIISVFGHIVRYLGL